MPSARNLVIGHGWIFHQDSDPKQTSKSKQIFVTEHKMKLLSWPSQFPDLMSGVNWRDEAPTWIRESEGSGESLYGGMVSDLLSGVLQTQQNWLQTGKRRLQNVFNKRVPVLFFFLKTRKRKLVIFLVTLNLKGCA